MLELQRDDGVWVLHMRGGENRFNLDSLQAIHRALDEVEASTEAGALVTVGEGKFYSNGLDLEWMSAAGRERAEANIDQVHALLGRLLAFPLITVAALNGHTFAAGAMLALAHDFRVMRTERGYFCLPEVDIRIPFTPAMSAMIQARLSKATAHEAMVTGRRYSAEQALQAGIVQQIAAEQQVLPAALALAKSLSGKDRATLATIKQTAYRSALDALAAARAK